VQEGERRSHRRVTALATHPRDRRVSEGPLQPQTEPIFTAVGGAASHYSQSSMMAQPYGTNCRSQHYSAFSL